MAIDFDFTDGAFSPPPQRPQTPEKPAFDKVPDHLLRNTQDAEVWQQSIAEFVRIMKTIDPVGLVEKTVADLDVKDDRNSKCREALQPARNLIGAMPTSSWPQSRSYMTYGGFETAVLVTLCTHGLLGWQTALDAKALTGTAGDVQKIADAARDNGQSLNFSSALGWAAQPKLLVQGLYFKGNLETTEKLFDLGALPNYNSQNLFLEVVEKADFDIARAFARRAHTVGMDMERYINWAKSNSRPAMYENFRKLHWEYGRYNVADYETLVEKKQLADKSQISIVFNFAARRVSEIYEYGQPVQATKTDIAFEDYAEEAIKTAEKKLIELGGQPTPYDPGLPGKRGIAKPKLSHPAQ
jgi:hypothetical protein